MCRFSTTSCKHQVQTSYLSKAHETRDSLVVTVHINFAGCLGLSPSISSQFILEICAAATNCKKH